MDVNTTLKNFGLKDLPDLDAVVLGALKLISETKLSPSPNGFLKPLVVGSGNAASVGRILFSDMSAVYAEEGDAEKKLGREGGIDAMIIISASGGKHAVTLAKMAKEKNLNSYLITNNQNARAAEFLKSENVIVFPKNREPYTYNTSTYLSMIIGKTGENAKTIQEFILQSVEPKLLRNFGSYSAFTFIVPPEFGELRSMFRTKFDELFGPYVCGRIFTSEEIKHAKTVVPSGDELFVSFGVWNHDFGLPKNRLDIALPRGAHYGAALAIGYYVIGKIQKAHPPYFKNNIESYCRAASEIFGEGINPIVE
jgi:hypothetical protein